MIDFDAKIAALKPAIASRFCCDCLSGAAVRIAKYRWPRQEHLKRLGEIEQKLKDAFERRLAGNSLWLARMYVAAGAQTVAVWSSYGAATVESRHAYARFPEKAWAASGVVWKQAWESEQQWQTERLAEFLQKEKK